MNEAEVRTVIDSLLKKAGWRLPGVPSLNVGMEQRVVSASPKSCRRLCFAG